MCVCGGGVVCVNQSILTECHCPPLLHICRCWLNMFFSLSGLTPDSLGPPSHDVSPVSPEPMTPGAQSPSDLHYHSKAQHRRFSMEVSGRGSKVFLMQIKHQQDTVQVQGHMKIMSQSNTRSSATSLFSCLNSSPAANPVQFVPLPAQDEEMSQLGSF